jgi:hypothetical protein
LASCALLLISADENPKLPQWYKKRKFMVNEKESLIVLDLIKPPADDCREYAREVGWT